MTRAKWLTAPTGLAPAALKLWKAHAPLLYADGALTRENAEIAKLLCTALAVAEAAAAEIGRDGVTIVGASGAKKQNPAVAVLFQAQRHAADLLHKLDAERHAARLLGTVPQR
jgi:phage terminase small subunit